MRSADSPPREEGWTRHQENATKPPYWSAPAGGARASPIGRSHQEKVVAHKPVVGVSDHPVCGAEVGYAEIFLMPQPPLLTRRGIPDDQEISRNTYSNCKDSSQ